MDVVFVGIHGNFKSGKDTLANWLRQQLHCEIVVAHFAAPLRDAIEILTRGKLQAAKTWTEAEKAELVPKDVDWNMPSLFPSLSSTSVKHVEILAYLKEAEGKQTVGQLLQKIGTWAREVEDADIWIKRFDSRIQATLVQHEKLNEKKKLVILVPDLRFPNEVDYLMRKNAALIHIDTGTREIKDVTNRDTKHISERALDNFKSWTLILDNSKTLADYYTNCLAVLYYINAMLTGMYLTSYELSKLLNTRLDQLCTGDKQADALYEVEPGTHDMCDIVLEEYKRKLLGDYHIIRHMPNMPDKPLITLVRYLIPPPESATMNHISK